MVLHSNHVNDSTRQLALHDLLKEVSASGGGTDTWERIRSFVGAIHAQGRRSQVLDVGTGTGCWAYGFGDEEEFADVVGIDADLSNVGTATYGSRHDNVNFEELDVNYPLAMSSESFDVVHIRNIAVGVPNYLQMIERCARLLRPGGLLVLTEVELFYHTAVPDYSTATAIRTWQQALRDALNAKGVDPDVAERLGAFVTSSGVFTIDGGVEEIGIACGDNYGGHRFDRTMIESSFYALQPILLEHGYGASEVADLNEQCLKEILEVDSRYFQRVFTVCASKLRY